MKKNRRGFTLVEVSLFLAISGLLLVGIIAGTQSSISAQRFKDSVQNYVEFLRTVYSEVSNPQSPGDGRSDYAIYGKLVSFGQTMSMDGTSLKSNEQRIYTYDIVGESASLGTGAVAETLKSLNANVIIEDLNEYGVVTNVKFAGNVREYVPTWGSAIDGENNGVPYTGTILVVRHPRSGTITTLVSSQVIQINSTVINANRTKNFASVRTMLKDKLNTFSSKEVNFCVNQSGPNLKSDTRRNVRLMINARNPSGVDLVNQDDTSNKCLGK